MLQFFFYVIGNFRKHQPRHRHTVILYVSKVGTSSSSRVHPLASCWLYIDGGRINLGSIGSLIAQYRLVSHPLSRKPRNKRVLVPSYIRTRECVHTIFYGKKKCLIAIYDSKLLHCYTFLHSACTHGQIDLLCIWLRYFWSNIIVYI